MQLIAQMPTFAFDGPLGIGVFAGWGGMNLVVCGYFNGFLSFTACGLNDAGIDDGGLGFFYFELIAGKLLVDFVDEFV